MNGSEQAQKLSFTDADSKGGPPPKNVLANGDGSDQPNILLLTDADSKGGPPPTDMLSREMSLLRTNFLDSVKLGVAVGLGWGIMFVIISLIVWASGRGTVLDFFKLLYPGFDPNALVGIVLGFAWSALYGLLFGVIIGIIYNSLVRRSVLEGESWETYA